MSNRFFFGIEICYDKQDGQHFFHILAFEFDIHSIQNFLSLYRKYPHFLLEVRTHLCHTLCLSSTKFQKSINAALWLFLLSFSYIS